MKTTMCNIPEELLTRQLLIESIPAITILLILLIVTIVAFLWWIQSKEKLGMIYSRTALIAFFIIFFPLWWKSSFLATKVATNVFNSEYAALKLFANGCPNVLGEK